MLLLSAVAFLLQLSLSSCSSSKFIVNPETHRILDTEGRTRFFHGTNVVYKTAPFVPDTSSFDAKESFSVEDADLLASMGYNSIRLGVLWAGYEPTMGEYNETYLDIVEEIVNMAGERGIYSLLDMHQDVFNRKFCGNGVPDWAAIHDENNFPVPLAEEYETDENIYPGRVDCDSIPWPNYHFTYALEQSVGRLYQNYDGLLDRFVEFWGKVAERFSENEYILGYEIMNEPWCGNTYEEPELLIPGVADNRYLQPMYDAVNDRIREHDQTHLIFFESVTWEIAGIGETYGFAHPPGGDDFKNRSVLSFHNSVLPEVTPDDKYYDLRAKEIKRLGIAGFVTETNNDRNQLDLMDDLVRWGYSWHHWAYKWYGNVTWDNNGLFLTENTYDKCSGSMDECLDIEKVKTYARIYPQTIAGEVKYFHYAADSREAIFIYKPDTRIPGNTILAVPEWNYENGYTVTIFPSLVNWKKGCCTLALNATIELEVNSEWTNEEISVILTPA
ncbi:endoglycoceramidase [Eurytemora carolleeae]|uniref:endoglycoceramidase n=1 Tax=Eurytemora carolleeae TaxID=1294199 RepID=UPI000C77F838|nr:endoglycoceramidase [Eurytemora carolleeae]|eukprot:XP_023338628.1 endoglycoceramidase-like [Eurytemora affinis]